VPNPAASLSGLSEEPIEVEEKGRICERGLVAGVPALVVADQGPML
jgi:hypothetical protein